MKNNPQCPRCHGKLKKEKNTIECTICHLKFHLNHTDTCPHQNLKYDKRKNELTCKDCGLVIREPYPYVAGLKISYPNLNRGEEEFYNGNG